MRYKGSAKFLKKRISRQIIPATGETMLAAAGFLCPHRRAFYPLRLAAFAEKL